MSQAYELCSLTVEAVEAKLSRRVSALTERDSEVPGRPSQRSAACGAAAADTATLPIHAPDTVLSSAGTIADTLFDVMRPSAFGVRPLIDIIRQLQTNVAVTKVSVRTGLWGR